MTNPYSNCPGQAAWPSTQAPHLRISAKVGSGHSETASSRWGMQISTGPVDYSDLVLACMVCMVCIACMVWYLTCLRAPVLSFTESQSR